MSIPLRILMASLVVLGVWFQTTAGGIGAVREVCIGCEGEGWTISGGADASPSCCQDGATSASDADREPSARKRGDCDCIKVPLPGRVTLATGGVGGGTNNEGAATAALPAMRQAWSGPAGGTSSSARARPSQPPWGLTPSARRTVLVL